MNRRLFGKAGFVQVILTSAGNLAPPNYFVDMILRRPNYGASAWICLTKHDGGHLRGILTPWRPCLPHQHCRYNDNEERGKQPLHLRSVDSLVQELGTLGGCFKTR